MAKSYIDQKTDMMHQLLWTNILRQYVAVELVAMAAAVPAAGPALAAIVSNPFVQKFLLFLIENYLEIPVFRLLVRFGVFTSVDWQEDKIYSAYEAEAERLLPLHGKPEKQWTEQDEKEYSDAAEKLIHLNIPGWASA